MSLKVGGGKHTLQEFILLLNLSNNFNDSLTANLTSEMCVHCLVEPSSRNLQFKTTRQTKGIGDWLVMEEEVSSWEKEHFLQLAFSQFNCKTNSGWWELYQVRMCTDMSLSVFHDSSGTRWLIGPADWQSPEFFFLKKLLSEKWFVILQAICDWLMGWQQRDFFFFPCLKIFGWRLIIHRLLIGTLAEPQKIFISKNMFYCSSGKYTFFLLIWADRFYCCWCRYIHN